MDTSITKPMLTPTEALLRGFDPQRAVDLAAPGVGTAVPLATSNGEAFVPPRGASFAAPHAGFHAAAARTAALESRQGFRIGALNLMIRYADGSELTDLPAIYRLPHAPGWFAGMANLQGRLVPVFDLARRFDIGSADRAKPMLLVLAHGAEAAGIVIDGLPERLSFDATKTLADEECVSPAIRPFVKALHLVDSRMWLDLDVAALLDALEQTLAQNPSVSH